MPSKLRITNLFFMSLPIEDASIPYILANVALET